MAAETRISFGVVGAAGIAAIVAACGPSAGVSEPGSGGDATGAGGAGAVVGGAGGTPVPGGGGAPIFIPPTGSGGQGQGGLPEGTCGKSTVQGETITETRIEIQTQTRTETRTETREVVKPVAIYLMLDQSGSMIDGDKWGVAVRAINSFMSDPRSNGFTVALNIFSFNFLGNPPGCAACDGSDCRNPMVQWAALPGAATAIAAALNRAPIGIGTPIEAALRGVTMGCRDYETSHPQEDCVAVLITDGEPSGCDGSAAGLTSIASASAAAGVPTFAIGMVGADFNLLDQIATAGTSDCDPASPRSACNASSNAEFLAALELIRTTVTQTTTVDVQVPFEVEVEVEVPVVAAVPCTWGLPASQTTAAVDPNKVNVDLTNVTTGVTEELGLVQSEADCAAFTNGWYYDDPLAPTRILACPSVCDRVKTFAAKIDIIVGCESRQPVVR